MTKQTQMENAELITIPWRSEEGAVCERDENKYLDCSETFEEESSLFLGTSLKVSVSPKCDVSAQEEDPPGSEDRDESVTGIKIPRRCF